MEKHNLNKNDITFVTTCKGRLRHLKQSLPLFYAQNPKEIILVDYDCPEKSADWVEENYPEVKTIRVQGKDRFSLSKARNLGGYAANSNWICFIDADIIIKPNFVKWLRENLHQSAFYRASPNNGKRDLNTWGTCICSKEDFLNVGGYDEVFPGWGGEDDDFYNRLRLFGVGESAFPQSYVEAIKHNDASRTLYYDIKNHRTQSAINQIYINAKLHILQTIGLKRKIPVSQRKILIEKITDYVLNWRDDKNTATPQIKVNIVGERMLEKDLYIEKNVSIKIGLRKK